jgi:hypothetical protein
MLHNNAVIKGLSSFLDTRCMSILSSDCVYTSGIPNFGFRGFELNGRSARSQKTHDAQHRHATRPIARAERTAERERPAMHMQSTHGGYLLSFSLFCFLCSGLSTQMTYVSEWLPPAITKLSRCKACVIEPAWPQTCLQNTVNQSIARAWIRDGCLKSTQVH